MPRDERRPSRGAIHPYLAPTTIASAALAGADVRGLYATLGIELRGNRADAQTRCFASPQAHPRGDRRPSCSVSLVHGAWLCFGCGARGGAYDAACLAGYGPAAAMALLERFGLVEPGRRATGASSRPLRSPTPRRAGEPLRAWLAVGESEVDRYRQQLLGDARLLGSLRATRGWTRQAIERLGLGFDRGRVIFPIRDAHGALIGLLRYAPGPQRCGPKMLADTGSRRDLFPPPELVAARQLLLVEGEPDVVSAWSYGRAAVAAPGVAGWQPSWASRFAGRAVTIVFDADAQGRAAARHVQADLVGIASSVRVVDLFPGRSDGADLTDFLLERRIRRAG